MALKTEKSNLKSLRKNLNQAWKKVKDRLELRIVRFHFLSLLWPWVVQDLGIQFRAAVVEALLEKKNIFFPFIKSTRRIQYLFCVMATDGLYKRIAESQ